MILQQPRRCVVLVRHRLYPRLEHLAQFVSEQFVHSRSIVYRAAAAYPQRSRLDPYFRLGLADQAAPQRLRDKVRLVFAAERRFAVTNPGLDRFQSEPENFGGSVPAESVAQRLDHLYLGRC